MNGVVRWNVLKDQFPRKGDTNEFMRDACSKVLCSNLVTVLCSIK